MDSFRGTATLDRKGAARAGLRFALSLRKNPEIAEADLDSVRCTTEGCVVLDTRLGIELRARVERVKVW